MKSAGLIYALLCVAYGALAVLGLPPYGMWICMFFGMSLYYALFAQLKTARGAFACGWLFGFGYFGAGLWWIANALLVPGNEFRWVWPFAIAGLPAICAFFPALASLACFRFADRRKIAGYVFFAAAMALSEWLRGHIFSGFPWNLYGYVWTGFLPVAQLAALGGSYFLTLTTLFWVTLPGFIAVWPVSRRQKTALAAIALTVFATATLYGHARLGGDAGTFSTAKAAPRAWPGVAVRIVQANISQADKWDPAKTADNLRRMLALSAPEEGKPEAPVTVIVWPETALEYPVLANEQARALIRDTLGKYHHQVYLLTGLLRFEPQPDGRRRYYNSLVALDRELNLRTVYDKAHLVPFGEYIPLQQYVPMHPFVQFQGFTAGKGPATLTVGGAPPFSPLICYEVIFPGAVTADPRPDWMVNVTNDAWYGDSPGPRQHFAQARFRAIEEGLPLVRAAETGISGLIDPYGRVLYAAPLGTRAARNVGLPFPLPPTPYDRIGDLLFFVCAFASLVFALWPTRTPAAS